MTRCSRIVGPTLVALALLLSPPTSSNEAKANPSDAERAALMDLERKSHRWWLDGDTEALTELMKDDYRFVAPNGAVLCGTRGFFPPGALLDYNSAYAEGQRSVRHRPARTTSGGGPP